MYAVIKTGGKQYKVEQGAVLQVEKLEQNEGDKIEFNDVLMYSDGETVTLGSPLVENVKVKAEIILVFKYKRRKGYRRMRGHRQHYTQIKIDSIEA